LIQNCSDHLQTRQQEQEQQLTITITKITTSLITLTTHAFKDPTLYLKIPACSKSHLRRIFGPKRNEVTGEWRKLHNEELNNLYSSPNIVRVIKSIIMGWAGHVARMGEGGSVYSVLVGKPECRRPLGIPRRRWEDNIKMDLREVGCGCVDWRKLTQDRDRWRALVSAVMNLRVP
jgi:hypothetical protein